MHEDFIGVLSSGSVGNSMIVMNSGKGVLIDAGLSCKELERRLSLFGVEPSQIEALVLTHEHEDHIRGARKFSAHHGMPVYGTRGTLALSGLHGIRTETLTACRRISFGGISLRAFKVRHLAAEPVAVSLSTGGMRIGIATDLGSVTPTVVEELYDSDLLFIEANYDEKMLLDGDYPDFLKRVINGDHGHLSNNDAAMLTARASTARTAKVVLMHLSKDNNTPEAARETVQKRLVKESCKPEIAISEHGQVSGPYSLR